MKKWLEPIKEMGACGKALEWGEAYDTIEEAWAECERGDWMLWLVGKLSVEPDSDGRKKLVLAACQCARLALPYVIEGELRPLQAIETAEKWANGVDGVTLKEVRDAADAAAYAAHAAAYAADAAADAAKNRVLKQCADIVRERYDAPEIKGDE